MGRLLALCLPCYAGALPPQYALVDEAAYAPLAARRWRYQDGYAVPMGRAPRVPLHRFLVGAPAGMVVSHRNGDALDNRQDNLLLSTDALARAGRSPASIRALEREGRVYRVRVGPFVRLISRERYAALVEYARGAGCEARVRGRGAPVSDGASVRARRLSGRLGLQRSALPQGFAAASWQSGERRR